MSLLERMKVARQTSGMTNCAGTAFFITGVLSKDEHIEIIPTTDFPTSKNPPPLHYISQLEKIDSYEEGCLVLFRYSEHNNFPRHVGVVFEENGELKVISRECCGKNMRLDIEYLSENLKWAKICNDVVEFYRPKPLY